MGQIMTVETRAERFEQPTRSVPPGRLRARGRRVPAPETTHPPARRPSLARSFGFLVYGVSALLVVALLVAGWSYYTTPLVERARHPDYFTLKPGGTTGIALGVAGAALLLLIPLYSMRKRFKALRGLGALGRWLDVHIYLGTFGPALVVLHSGFKVRGLVAIAFWSMILVAISGLVGRFLYRQIPRSSEGDELSLAALERYDARLSARLREDFGLGEAMLSRIEGMAAPVSGRRSLSVAVAEMLRGGRARRSELRALAFRCHGVPGYMARRFEAVVLEKAAVHRRLALWSALQRLFYYWHTVHKPLALAMYVFMLIHIGVALMTGYGLVLFAG